MASTPPSGMIGRIKAILTDPKNEFQRIDAEPMTVGGIMTGWVVPLAAIGPVAGVIGIMMFMSRGISIGGVTISAAPSMTYLIANAVSQYVLALVGAFVCSLIVDALAPSFGGQKDSVKAMKLVAYGSTAAYLGGIFAIMPMLALFGLLLALYSLYLIYVGLPVLMKSPPDKTIVYMIVIAVVYIVVMVVGGYAMAMLTAPFAPAQPAAITFS